jgi:SDR family mycofactocin-dependent oxidoreductase
MVDLTGQVALVTGAARGQGRSHALALAQAGADVVVVDIADQIATVPYPMSTPGDLAETARRVEALDRRCVAIQADVRSLPALTEAVEAARTQLGRLDIVVANAGICIIEEAWTTSSAQWDDIIGVNLTGVFNTLRAATPVLMEQGSGGSMIVTASVAGIRAQANIAAYNAAKHGVLGVMKSFALELAPLGIRVNAVAPGNVDTPMIDNPAMFQRFRPDLTDPQKADAEPGFAAMNPMPVPWVDPADISAAVLWLASSESRYVTGQAIAVDAGLLLK